MEVDKDDDSDIEQIADFRTVYKHITRGVMASKFSGRRHLVLPRAISPTYLLSIMPLVIQNFSPQHVRYNGGVGSVPDWKISCYIDVMDGGVPTANPHFPLREVCLPLLGAVDDLFLHWYRQQNHRKMVVNGLRSDPRVRRLMTFVTRYSARRTEDAALLKHIDGAGKVDGSAVVALPIDEWSDPPQGEVSHDFTVHPEGGGGLTFWDGNCPQDRHGKGIHYDTRSGDLAFIDKAVWHEACPIKAGTRW
eukprot:CAMPEP_0113316928 /NCGR_PEP_ID=MMETSP0010_2-20120614/12021_1 /TAXON_ID=216773 ORGANISM="Corethron hystrix, Strain 308" /NCGR_SAMPLE_ID=MMETSP0010_2 /ASSEMBLY_ACC=CAM_ASM_000155 /LENGTH=248 /DNA_ID=CAMNT_0000173769 /DNA_START=119 /DNA_END=862 /DNA_ORIENTATION=+ /assembly_acc=CAM_ASM_000155